MLQDCPPALAPDVVNCSGRALDCSLQQCICEEDWLGTGDFVSGSPACQLNEVAIQVLWAAVAVAHFVNLLLCIRFLILRPRRNIKWREDSNLLAGLGGMLASLCLVPLGMLRAIRPEATIGTDPAVSVLFTFAAAGFWSFSPMLAFSYLRVLSQNLRTRNGDERTKVVATLRHRKTLIITWALSIFAAICPTLMLINPQSSGVMFGFGAAHYILLAIVEISYFFLVQDLTQPLIADITSVISVLPDERLSAVAKKVQRLNAEIRNQALVQAISAAIFGCWPYAQRYATYHLAIAWFATAFIIAVGLNTLLPNPKKSSTVNSDTANSNRTNVASVSHPKSGPSSPKRDRGNTGDTYAFTHETGTVTEQQESVSIQQHVS